VIRLFLCLFLIPLALASQYASADNRDELQELRKRLEDLRREYQATRESHADAAGLLRQSERAISDAKRRLRILESEQQKTRSELDDVNTQLNLVNANIDTGQKRLAEMLRQSYKRGGSDSLKLLLGGKDPNQISREMVYLNYLSRGQLDVIESLRSEFDHLERLKKTASDKDRTLTEIRQAKAAEQEKLLNEKQARQILLNKLTGRIKSQKKEITALRQDEKRLSELVARLARLAKQRNEKAKRKPAIRNGQTKPTGPVGINTQLPDATMGNASFSRLKGLLRLPVRGELMNRFGAPREDGGLTWKGVFIRALEGAEVKAIASGRVVFAEWLRGFGNLLIVDHGEGYMSLYSNNESLYKQPGESVKTGDTIATAGNSGGQEELGVYFELRHQGRPINPMAWIK